MFGESLEDVELAMKMEKVQQFSSQRTDWKDLGESMKRNLKGKSSTLNTDLRLDIIDSCKRLKKEVPLDKESEICPQIQTLAESMDLSYSIECSKITLKGAEVTIDLILSVDKTRIDQCGVNFFGKKEDSPEGRDLINANEMELFREAIYSTQNAVPQAANLNERRSLFRALELIEVWLSRHQKKISSNPTFQDINTHSTGYSVTRKTTRLTRIYYFCDPQCEKRSGRNTFHPEKDLNLPHLELRLISSDKPNNNFPDGPNSEPFSSKKELPACISLRFGKPMLISRTILIQLQKHMSKHPIVRERVNLYAYTSSFDKAKSNQLVFRTNFPKSSPPNQVYQHRYIMRLESLQDETDSVVSELFLDDIRSLEKVLRLLRTQHMHNILWDSLISTTNKVPWEGKSSIKLEIAIPSPTCFEFKFAANEHLYLIRVEENASSKKWGVRLIGTDGEPNCPSDVNKSLTFAMNQDFNLPTTIQETLKAVAAQPTPDSSDFSTDLSKINGQLSFADKPGQSWLPRPRPVVPEIEMTHKLGSPKKVEKEEEKENEDDLPPSFSLMGFWREIEEISLPVQNRTVEAAPQPRNVRIISEQNYSKAFSDLEAFCQSNEPVESEEKKPPTTPYFGPASAKLFESSPAPRPGGIPQLSPLETARLRMTQTVVQSGLPPGLGPSSADIFDFSDDRSAGSSGSSYPSPAPHIPNPFNFPSIQVANAAVRGAKTRRPRQRKAGNIGDRTGSTDSNAETMKKIKMQKPTMMGTVRGARGRGSRKSSGLPPELERPMLQRSYSDYLNQPPFSMATPSHIPSPLTQEDDSDGTELCDPPSPPKAEALEATLAAQAAAAAAALAQAKARKEQSQAAVAAQSTTLSSLLANDPLEKLRIQPSRKSSYEMLPKKTSLTSMPPQLVKNPKTNHISDIYDDGLDSSPPALGAPMVNLAQISQLNNSASSSGGPPVLTAITKVDSPLTTSSPKTDSVGSNSNDGPPKIEKIEANKIILKIPKQRSSPAPTTFEPTTSSGIKVKTKSEKEKSHQKKKEPKLKEPKEEKPKLSREEKQKEKEEAIARKRGRNETISVPEDKIKPQPKRKKGYIEPTPVVNEPPGSSLPFLQQSLRKNFKIPKKEDKDASKEPITPTTPLAPPLSSPAGPTSQPPSSSSSSSSFPTAGPIHPPKSSMNNKKNIMHQAAIRLNLPATQPATYLPKNSKNSPIQKNQPLSNRRYSTKEPPERPQVSNIPLPKERAGFVERSAYTGATRWVKAPAAPINKQPPQAPPQLTPRSPSPEAMQVDESSSPEDSLRISEDA